MLVTCLQTADFPRRNKTNRKQADQDVFVNAFELTVNTSIGEQPNSMNLELK